MTTQNEYFANLRRFFASPIKNAVITILRGSRIGSIARRRDNADTYALRFVVFTHVHANPTIPA